MNFAQRSYESELLDRPGISIDQIHKNLKELSFINKWLGGHRVTIIGLKRIIGVDKTVSICEIGCGGGDNLAAINKWCNNRGIKPQLTGIDIKPECIDFAITNSQLPASTHWIVSDYNNVTFDRKPDVIFSSLFCHHFTNEQLLLQLRWMQLNSEKGFFINDLQRHWLAYYSIRWLTSVFSSSQLVKHDAPLSVARSFIKSEWLSLLKQAQISSYKILWQWAFRYLITHLK
jgi:2-polyprenyl-3-methyl-5-hydroxy-6-metoxy-1,4-benzoquinol methylase